MVHTHRENTAMRFSVTVQKTKRDGWTDKQTDGGAPMPLQLTVLL